MERYWDSLNLNSGFKCRPHRSLESFVQLRIMIFSVKWLLFKWILGLKFWISKACVTVTVFKSQLVRTTRIRCWLANQKSNHRWRHWAIPFINLVDFVWSWNESAKVPIYTFRRVYETCKFLSFWHRNLSALTLDNKFGKNESIKNWILWHERENYIIQLHIFSVPRSNSIQCWIHP